MQNISKIEINNFNFIIPVIADNGKELKVYVPQPIEKELRGLAHILGHLFTKIRAENVDLLMFVKDWKIFAEEKCANLENGENSLKALNSFLERSLLGSTIFNEDGTEKEILSAAEKEFFEGALVFISALYRYSPHYIKMLELGDFFTSLTPMEFKNSLQKSQGQFSPANGVVMKRA